METVLTSKIQSEEYKNYFLNGITYSEYLKGVEKDALLNSTDERLSHVPLNWQRIKRITKTIHLLDETKNVLNKLPSTINWLLISEHWCGDASQITPVINALAENSNGKIILRVVYRDKNPELIDAHLTNNARAIPILIQLNQDFKITGVWGPRPVAGQKLVVELKSDPSTAAIYAESLHKWYATDKQVSIQQELIKLLASY